jgi:hypothetical protein
VFADAIQQQVLLLHPEFQPAQPQARRQTSGALSAAGSACQVCFTQQTAAKPDHLHSCWLLLAATGDVSGSPSKKKRRKQADAGPQKKYKQMQFTGERLW